MRLTSVRLDEEGNDDVHSILDEETLARTLMTPESFARSLRMLRAQIPGGGAPEGSNAEVARAVAAATAAAAAAAMEAQQLEAAALAAEKAVITRDAFAEEF